MRALPPRGPGWLAECLSGLGLLGLGLLSACGGSPAVAINVGRPADEPSIESLPGLEGQTREEFSEAMRFAWLLTEESFELVRPALPAGDSSDAIERWSTGPLQNWLSQKNHLVEAARAELNRAAEENRQQQVLAGALVGLMYEDVARVLLDVPLPREFRGEPPEIQEAFHYVVEAQAAPYLAHARRAYRACAINGARVDMRPWAVYCSARRESLPLSHEDEVLATTETTTVEVIIE